MLNWTPIQSLLKNRELLMMIKVLKGMAPEYLTQMFKVSTNHMYDLRSNHKKLYLQKPKTNFLKRRFAYRGASLWNETLVGKVPMIKLNEITVKAFK